MKKRNRWMCKVQEFDQFFIQQYDYLKSFSQSINPLADYEGLLHDCYVKCKNRIIVAGFSGNTFINFVRVTIVNQYKSNYRLQQKRHNVHYNEDAFPLPDDPHGNWRWKIEEKLQEIQEQEEQEQETQGQISYINTMIFQYIDENYDDRDKFIFKTYFLLKPKKINYKQLSEATGFSISTVSNTIKGMKQDIKANLEEYINGRQTISGHTVCA